VLIAQAKDMQTSNKLLVVRIDWPGNMVTDYWLMPTTAPII